MNEKIEPPSLSPGVAAILVLGPALDANYNAVKLDTLHPGGKSFEEGAHPQ